MTKIIEDIRMGYVFTRDAADEWRTADTEFALGVAHGIDLVADLMAAILEENDE